MDKRPVVPYPFAVIMRPFRRLASLAAALVALASLTGCAALGGFLVLPVVRAQSAAFFASGDADKAGVDAPGNLRLLRTIADLAPDQGELQVAVAQSLGGHALGFLDPVLTPGFQPPAEGLARAKDAYRTGRLYGLRALAHVPGLAANVDGDLEEFRAAVDRAGLAEVPALFWTAYNWGQLALLSFDDIEVSAEFEKAEIMMRRAEALLPGYYHGGAKAFLMVRYASRSPLLGGDPGAARLAWQESRAVDSGRFLMTDVLFAQYGCVQTQDLALFDQVIAGVLAASADALPEERLANLLAQRRARILRDRRAETFAAAEGPDDEDSEAEEGSAEDSPTSVVATPTPEPLPTARPRTGLPASDRKPVAQPRRPAPRR